MIKNIIFDIGDVLLEFRWKEMLMDYGLSESEALRIGNEIFEDSLWGQLDLGDLTDQAAADAYREKYPEDADVIEYFIVHSEYMHVPRPEIWKELRVLKKQGYHIYLLSNYPKSFFEKHMQYADFMEDIDGRVVSYELHIVKPDRRIYDYLCTKYELQPAESLFLDDRTDNIEAARNYGMQGVVVKSRKHLLEEMKKMEGLYEG